jgi:uncharacterized protein YndB with AHSA1/START domain
VIAAPRERVWDLVADPHHLPRWWPRAKRVESVRGAPGSKRTQWTTVLGTQRGSGVRADFRCVSAARPERYVWQQDVEGTPFQRILKSAALEIRLAADGTDATAVTLESAESLRGLSRLGALMVRRATRRRLDEALDGIELATVRG